MCVNGSITYWNSRTLLSTSRSLPASQRHRDGPSAPIRSGEARTDATVAAAPARARRRRGRVAHAGSPQSGRAARRSGRAGWRRRRVARRSTSAARSTSSTPPTPPRSAARATRATARATRAASRRARRGARRRRAGSATRRQGATASPPPASETSATARARRWWARAPASRAPPRAAAQAAAPTAAASARATPPAATASTAATRRGRAVVVNVTKGVAVPRSDLVLAAERRGRLARKRGGCAAVGRGAEALTRRCAPSRVASSNDPAPPPAASAVQTGGGRAPVLGPARHRGGPNPGDPRAKARELRAESCHPLGDRVVPARRRCELPTSLIPSSLPCAALRSHSSVCPCTIRSELERMSNRSFSSRSYLRIGGGDSGWRGAVISAQFCHDDR